MAQAPLDALSPIPDPKSPGFGNAVKQALNVLLGRTGRAGDRAVTLAEVQGVARQAAGSVTPETPFSAEGLPDPPTGLQVSRLGLQALLAWIAPSDDRVMHIEIWRAENSQVRTDAVLMGWGSADATQFIDYGVLPGSFYTYWIRSKGWNGLFSVWEPPDNQGGGTIDAVGPGSVNEALELIAGGDYRNNFRVIADAFQVVQPSGDVPDWGAGSYAANVLVKVPGGPAGYTYYRSLLDANETRPPSAAWVWVDPVALGVAKRVFTVGKLNNAPAVGIAGDMVIDGTIMARALAAELVLSSVLVTPGFNETGATGWKLDARTGQAVFNNIVMRLSSTSSVVDANGQVTGTVGGIQGSAAQAASDAAAAKAGAARAAEGLTATGEVRKIIGSVNLPTANPFTSGLYLTGNYLGYYSGSEWKCYIDKDGKFLFKGDATHYLGWNGSSLILQGRMQSADGGTYVDLLATGSQKFINLRVGGKDVFWVAADGTGYIATYFLAMKLQATYATPGVSYHLVPAGCSMVWVSACAAGAGGGVGVAGNFGAAGGGAGKSVTNYPLILPAGTTSLSIVIGPGGPGGTGVNTGTPGIAGGDTVIYANYNGTSTELLRLGGGKPSRGGAGGIGDGGIGAPPVPAQPGADSNLRFGGAPGAAYASGVYPGGGGGNASDFGDGGAGGTQTGVSSGTNGAAGGSGAGGGGASDSGNAGGPGGNGLCQIFY